MTLKVHNTLSGAKEAFVPLKNDAVRMYVCGVTVYDRCHVGHARSLLVFDVIYRYLKFLGYNVIMVRNFTDVDDKIIDRAKEEGSTPEAVAAKYIQEFYQESAHLGLLAPTHEPRATEHIPEMIALICRLEEKGVAYKAKANGDVFFSVDRSPGYGRLSHRKIEELEAGARVEVDERKRCPMDFVLWKASKEGEPSWESPWGQGRPGWHVECSAMSVKYLGQPFDIHGGGMDLIFPHHENEIAQSEGASGGPFVRYWIHHGLVDIDQEKMSKSQGNFYTVQEVLERHDAASLRHYLLGSHYRSPIDFSLQGLEEAERGVERIYETLDRVERAVPSNGLEKPEEGLLNEFRVEMDDDFNTPKAMALIFEGTRSLNRMLDVGKIEGLSARWAAVKTMAEVLGLLQDHPGAYLNRRRERSLQRLGLSAEAVEDIEELIRKRERARGERRWQEADQIRNELKERGIILEDTPGGTIWRAR